MTKCPDCGTEFDWFEESCKKCGTPRPKTQVEAAQRRPEPARTAETTDDEAPALERDIRALRRQLLAHTSGLAGALSAVIPGLGQIYAGSPGSGIPIMLAWLVGVPTYVTWVSRSLVQPASRWLPRPEFTTAHALVGLVIVVLWIANILHAISVSQALQGSK